MSFELIMYVALKCEAPMRYLFCFHGFRRTTYEKIYLCYIFVSLLLAMVCFVIEFIGARVSLDIEDKWFYVVETNWTVIMFIEYSRVIILWKYAIDEFHYGRVLPSKFAQHMDDLRNFGEYSEHTYT